MNRDKLIQIMLWIAVIAWMMIVLFLTLQNGANTARTSNKIAKEAYQILVRYGINVEYTELHQVLRIAAHFFVFCVFGVLVGFAVLASSKQAGVFGTCIPILFICTAMSIMPEVMKVWIPGRHLQWDEVVLNVIGAYVGVFGAYVIPRSGFH